MVQAAPPAYGFCVHIELLDVEVHNMDIDSFYYFMILFHSNLLILGKCVLPVGA